MFSGERKVELLLAVCMRVCVCVCVCVYVCAEVWYITTAGIEYAAKVTV